MNLSPALVDFLLKIGHDLRELAQDLVMEDGGEALPESRDAQVQRAHGRPHPMREKLYLGSVTVLQRSGSSAEVPVAQDVPAKAEVDVVVLRELEIRGLAI